MRDIATDLANYSYGFEIYFNSDDTARDRIASDFVYLNDATDDEYNAIIKASSNITDIDEFIDDYDILANKLKAIVKSKAKDLFNAHEKANAPKKQDSEPQILDAAKKQAPAKEKTLADKLSDINKANKNISSELFSKITASFGIIDTASDETLNELQTSVQALNTKLDTIPTKPVGKTKVNEILDALTGIERGTYNEIPLSEYVDNIIADITKSQEDAKAAKEAEKEAKKTQQEQEKEAKQAQRAQEKASKDAQKLAKQAEDARVREEGINAAIQETIATIEQEYPQTKELYIKWVSDYINTVTTSKVSVDTIKKTLAKGLTCFGALDTTIKTNYEKKLKDTNSFDNIVRQIIDSVSQQDTKTLKAFKDSCVSALKSIVASAKKPDISKPDEVKDNNPNPVEPPKPTDDIDDIISRENDMYAVSEDDDNPFGEQFQVTPDAEPIEFSPTTEQKLRNIFNAIDMNASFTSESDEAKQYVREMLADPTVDETTKNNIINFNGRNTELLRSIFDHVNHKDAPTSIEPPANEPPAHETTGNSEATLENPDVASETELESPLYPPDSRITEYAGIWDRAIITEFGYPFINFSNPIISGILKNDDDAKAEFKMQLRNAKLNTKRLAGKLWDYLFSTPIKLMSALYHSRYTSKKLNYIRVSADEMFSDNEFVHINPIKIDNKEADFYDTQMLSRVFINQFYSYISVDDTKIYAKYNEMSETEYEALRRANQRPEFYVLVPKKSAFRVSETNTAEGFGGTLLSLLTLRDKSVLVRAKINKRDGGFVMPKKLADNLFTKFI